MICGSPDDAAADGGGESFYRLRLAGVELNCGFAFEETPCYFGQYCRGPFSGRGSLAIPEWYWDVWQERIGPKDPHNEYSAMAAVCSAALTAFDRCVIHAAAIRFRDRAWLISAPSGVGKSTLVRTLQEMWPDRFGVISGDRPVLELCQTETVVHPSPWNGKEGWHGAPSAPLAALVLLERGDEDRLIALSPGEAALSVYTLLLQIAEDTHMLRRMGEMEEKILMSAPVWRLKDRDPVAAAKLLYAMMNGDEIS